ncbi:hypothetical protein GE061_005008 [Apolygus lucorum]|uniref:RING-type domain-containing protein n=1 Tax=Apolygus lucorum TaxID=248454 RepID=A0A8S9WYZ0_APOLU|nr:hypothetical protein GE061_005008 [Apolygus lucorum]
MKPQQLTWQFNQTRSSSEVAAPGSSNGFTNRSDLATNIEELSSGLSAVHIEYHDHYRTWAGSDSINGYENYDDGSEFTKQGEGTDDHSNEYSDDHVIGLTGDHYEHDDNDIYNTFTYDQDEDQYGYGDGNYNYNDYTFGQDQDEYVDDADNVNNDLSNNQEEDQYEYNDGNYNYNDYTFDQDQDEYVDDAEDVNNDLTINQDEDQYDYDDDQIEDEDDEDYPDIASDGEEYNHDFEAEYTLDGVESDDEEGDSWYIGICDDHYVENENNDYQDYFEQCDEVQEEYENHDDYNRYDEDEGSIIESSIIDDDHFENENYIGGFQSYHYNHSVIRIDGFLHASAAAASVPIGYTTSSTTISAKALEVKRRNSVDDILLCVVCLSESRQYAPSPCHHLSLCKNCADLLERESHICPICRKDFTSLLRIYL